MKIYAAKEQEVLQAEVEELEVAYNVFFIPLESLLTFFSILNFLFKFFSYFSYFSKFMTILKLEIEKRDANIRQLQSNLKTAEEILVILILIFFTCSNKLIIFHVFLQVYTFFSPQFSKILD